MKHKHHYEEAGNRRGDIHLDLSHFVGLEFWCAVVVDEADPTGELKTREQTCHSDAHDLLNDTKVIQPTLQPFLK